MSKKNQTIRNKISNIVFLQGKRSCGRTFLLSSCSPFVTLIVGSFWIIQSSPLRAMEVEDSDQIKEKRTLYSLEEPGENDQLRNKKRKLSESLQSLSTDMVLIPSDDAKIEVSATGFYKDAEHPLTHRFWKGKDLSDRLQKIKNEIEIIKKEIEICHSNSVNLNGDELDIYKKILKCTKSNSPLVQDLQKIEYNHLLIGFDNSKKITSGWTRAEVIVLPFNEVTVAIKKFKDIKEGLEELLQSLVALDINPSPQEIKMARVYDATFCSENSENCLSIIMEAAKGHDIEHFLKEGSATNAVKSCAEYLAMFHIRNHQKLTENIDRKKYIDHVANAYHTLLRNSLKEEEKEEIKLLDLSVGATFPDSNEVKSDNIIRSLLIEKQEKFKFFVKESCKRFENNTYEIFRLQDTKKQRPYFLTITHGDAHGNNFFYCDEELTKNGNQIRKDSFQRITMIDFATIIRTYGGIGDPAEDVGRFLASLWDWGVQQAYTESEGYKAIHNLQNQFVASYLEIIKYNKIFELNYYKEFEKIFKENCNFYKLRYYKVIFNSTKDEDPEKDREIKLKILNSWLEENSTLGVSLDVTTQENYIREESKDRDWAPIKEGGIHCHLPERSEVFIESFDKKNESYLTLLWKELHDTRTAILSSNAAIAGMGGVGKTSLALEYAHEANSYNAYNWIYWLSSGTEASLLRDYRKLLLEMGIPKKDIEDKDDDGIIDLVKLHIPTKGKCLLIYDNVPGPNFLTGKVPGKTHILTTSRYTEGWGKPPINLDVFSLEDSIKYLLMITGLKESPEIAGELAEALGRLPLALSHAAHYIRLVGGNSVSKETFEEYLKDFKNLDPLTHLSENKDSFKNPKSTITYEHLIGRTLGISRKYFSRGATDSNLLEELITYSAYLYSDFIPEDIFLELYNKESLEEALSQLSSLSLIKRAHNQPTFSMHRLLQLVIRNEKESGLLKNISMCSVVNMVNNFFSKNIYTFDQIYNLLENFPNILQLLEHSRRLMMLWKNIETLEWWGVILLSIGKTITFKDKNNKNIEHLTNNAENFFYNHHFSMYSRICEKKKYNNIPDWLEDIAIKSHPKIQYALGSLYMGTLYVGPLYAGPGIGEMNAKRAHFWYTKAANKGDAYAEFALGRIYEKGQGVEQSHTEAVTWYRKAAEQGYSRAQFKLGKMYYNGWGVEQDYAKSEIFYRRAAKEGFEKALLNLQDIFFENQASHPTFVDTYCKADEQQLVKPLLSPEIGCCIEEETGLSDEKTLALYYEVASKGDAEAQLNLGKMYEIGRGVQRCCAEAAIWYHRAAKQGNAFAQNKLGEMYYDGRAVKESDTEAVTWFRKAAEQGYARAQFNLGKMYCNGWGIGQSDTEARAWYEKAAHQGDADAQFRLRYMWGEPDWLDQKRIEIFSFETLASKKT